MDCDGMVKCMLFRNNRNNHERAWIRIAGLYERESRQKGIRGYAVVLAVDSSISISWQLTIDKP